MKLLFDMFPVILFFISFKISGIFVATAVAIVASIGQILWLRLRGKVIENMQWVSLGIIVVFGGMTLVFHDETFIKWKPTVLYWLFAVALIVGRYLMSRNLIKAMMGKQVQLPERIWDHLNIAWILFFALLGGLNILIAYRFSTETWVNFKLFGSLGLTVAFVIAQALYFTRHVIEDKQ